VKKELAKARPDAWDATLTDEQRWRAYAQSRRCPWYEVAKWVADEFGIKPPSRAGYYRWVDRMRTLESAHRVEQAIIARNETAELAEAGGMIYEMDAKRVAAYQSLAQDIALRTGDAKTANTYVQMAMMIAAGQTRRQELELKARAQATKDETLRLAREKFEAAERRLQSTRDTIARLNATGALTPEARREIETAMGML
jgi:hypothetical protein